MTSFWSRYRCRQTLQDCAVVCQLGTMDDSQNCPPNCLGIHVDLKTWFELKKKAWQRKSVDIEFGPLCGPLNEKKMKENAYPSFFKLACWKMNELKVILERMHKQYELHLKEMAINVYQIYVPIEIELICMWPI